MDRIKSVNLDREYKIVGPEIERVTKEVLSSGKFILGPKCQELENKLAEFCGTNYAVTVANGTDAIRLALLAAGVKKDSIVNVPDFTFAATAEAPLSVGAKINPVPVDKNTFQIEVISGITIAVDLFGLMSWPNEKNISYKASIIIEDAAQAIGATYNGNGIGHYSDVATISFYPTKSLGACGDAGAVVTNDKYIASEIKLLRDHHMSDKYIHTDCGYNSRMDELQASILLVKLPYLNRWIDRKIEIAKMYSEGLSDLPISLPITPDNCRHAFHQYTIRTPLGVREMLKSFLDLNGIDSSVFYPAPISSMSGLCSGEKLLRTQNLCNKVLSLPVCAHLTNEEVNMVIETVQRFFEGEKKYENSAN